MNGKPCTHGKKSTGKQSMTKKGKSKKMDYSKKK